MAELTAYLRRRWREIYHRSSIQVILSLFFTAVAVVGMVFLGLTLFLRFSASNNALMAENSQRVLSQVNLNLDARLREMMRVSDAAYYRVIKDADLAEEDIARDLELLYYTSRESLVSIAVFSDSGDLIAAAPLAVLKNSVSPEREGWFSAAQERIENLHFSTPHVQNLFVDPDYRYRWVVSLSRHVELTRDGAIESGVLLVDMSYSGIEQICKDVDLGAGQGGYLYLVDGAGEIVYHPRQQLIYAGLLEENNASAAAYADGSHNEVFQGQRRQVTVKTVGYTGWKLVGVAPARSWMDASLQPMLFGLTLLLFGIFLIAFLNYLISARISDPIRRLELSIRELDRDLGSVRIEEGGCYEVQRLSHAISAMVSTMRHLMDDIVRQEEQKRRSELEVLQSQINPHFLYNTLDSVIWMTESGQQQEAIRMVTSLARLFRISLSKGKSIIPLADELEHARHYMNIQQIRYKNKFVTRIEAGPGTEGLYTLKLIVQPILENAIYHGMPGVEDDGEITVSAYREGEDLMIDVRDNGLGMRPDVAASLLDEDRPEVGTGGSGIGVRNVHQRVTLTFGEGYGLTIFSEPDEGTLVRIRLPALSREEADRCQRGEVL